MKTKSRFDRIKGAIWFSLANTTMTLIGGCGGIGSWLSLLLNRTGVQPIIFDHDLLESHNLAGQLMMNTSIGNPKVEAMAQVLSAFTGEEAYHIFNERVDEGTPMNEFAISAFDNMKARKTLFHSWLAEYGGDPNALYMDGRLRPEYYEIFMVRANDIDAINRYQADYLFDDNQVDDGDCTFKQTSHMAAMLTGNMTGLFTNHLGNLVEGEQIYAVPFLTTYSLLNNDFNDSNNDS